MGKKRPILFDTVMVRAIREGYKSSTRRLFKFLETKEVPTCPDRLQKRAFNLDSCPSGIPGDCLWIRETFFPHDEQAILNMDRSRCECAANYVHSLPNDKIKWIPSTRMPRWASRTVLKIQDVKIERLQELTPDDSDKEGMSFPLLKNKPFSVIWDGFYGKKPGCSWRCNPWVWVIDFTVLESYTNQY